MGLFSTTKTISNVQHATVSLWSDDYILKNAVATGVLNHININTIIKEYGKLNPVRLVDQSVKRLNSYPEHIQVNNNTTQRVVKPTFTINNSIAPDAQSTTPITLPPGLTPAIQTEVDDMAAKMGLYTEPGAHFVPAWTSTPTLYAQLVTLENVVNGSAPISHINQDSLATEYQSSTATSASTCGNAIPIKENYNYTPGTDSELKGVQGIFRRFNLPFGMLVSQIKKHAEQAKMRSVYLSFMMPFSYEHSFIIREWFLNFQNTVANPQDVLATIDWSTIAYTPAAYKLDSNNQLVAARVVGLPSNHSIHFTDGIEYDIELLADSVSKDGSNQTINDNTVHGEFTAGLYTTPTTLNAPGKEGIQLTYTSPTNEVTVLTISNPKIKRKLTQAYSATDTDPYSIYYDTNKLTDFGVNNKEALYEQFRIPLNHASFHPEFLKTDKDKQFFMEQSLTLTTYIRYKQSLAWYETGVFGAILKSIAIISFAMSLGGAANLSTFLFTLGTNILLKTLIVELSGILVDVFGEEVGTLLTTIVVITVGIKTGDINFNSIRNTTMAVTKLTNQGLKLYSQATYEQLQKEYEALKEQKEYLSELEEKNANKTHAEYWGNWEGYDFTKEITRYPMDSLLITPNEFYDVKLNIDPVPITLNYVKLFYTIMSDIPVANRDILKNYNNR